MIILVVVLSLLSRLFDLEVALSKNRQTFLFGTPLHQESKNMSSTEEQPMELFSFEYQDDRLWKFLAMKQDDFFQNRYPLASRLCWES